MHLQPDSTELFFLLTAALSNDFFIFSFLLYLFPSDTSDVNCALSVLLLASDNNANKRKNDS